MLSPCQIVTAVRISGGSVVVFVTSRNFTSCRRWFTILLFTLLAIKLVVLFAYSSDFIAKQRVALLK